ncbi:hypothetical protein KPL71_018706 [Citrus sinensis]|uniref:Uncharacterized protein n=1 Tax=Citrus sinensis TaxID=2711 RepID=A0ACB8K0N7_CITSI|nr:hypothetical protein KPL71_018706 [Citrus sinensis]
MTSISTCFTTTPKSRFFFTPLRPLINLKPPDSFPRIQPLPFPRISGKIPGSRVLVPVAKASTDVAVGVGPGRIVESDKLPADVRNRAMDAVDACNRRVTIGDVAGKAGLKLNEAQKALQALAADTDGFLEVSDEGDVLYVFPNNYRAKLAAKSFRLKVEPVIDKAKAAAEYSIRVLFGTALIASIVIVFTAIIAILSSKRYWDPYYYRRRRVQTDDDDKKMNFIESVFSFVFGEGDPNQGIEEKRWKLIGEYIASNGGVVTAEELAPYLDIDRTMSDESYVLPVLLRFDGQPEIDEERTAASQRIGRKEYVGRRWADAIGGVEKIFREKKWEFSKTNMSERGMAIGLGGLNLFGVIILGAMLQEMAVTPNGFLKFVAYIFPLLQIYAGSFFAIPAVRWFLNLQRNADIEKRNRTREKYARALKSPDISLRRKVAIFVLILSLVLFKLLSARDMAQKTFIGQDRIVYSTDRDLIEQDYEAREWEKRFREIE